MEDQQSPPPNVAAPLQSDIDEKKGNEPLTESAPAGDPLTGTADNNHKYADPAAPDPPAKD